MMPRAPVLLLVGAGLAACAGHPAPVSQAPVPAAPPPAVVTRTTDTVSSKPDSAAVAATVRSEDVEKEAVRLFGPEGREIVAGADDTDLPPTFDINVTSYATNRRVLAYLEFFQVDARDRFAIWLSRLSRYEGMIRDRLRAKGLPEDLVYLTLIESGLSNSAVSRARAVGMWQFVSGTGRLYGLEVDPWVDERRDPYKATDAAVNYLSDLVQRLGSVYLAAAAYNAGEGRIQRGVRHLPGQSDSLTDDTFFQLADRRYLRRETRDYVPKLIAAALIAKQPDRYGFTDIPRVPPLQFDEIRVSEATGLDVLARLADTTTEALVELNPQFVRRVTPPGREVTVRVPRGTGTRVAEGYDTLPATSRITFVEHYVTRGQTLSDIAKQYRVSIAMIQGANPSLRSRSLRVGTRVVIPMSGRTVPGSSWKSATADDGARIAARSDGAATSITASHRVRRGETASQIARRYGVDLDALLDYNGLSRRSVIKAGQVLKIPPSPRAIKNQSE
ncbi:MAG TPA: LysM peptidoglycan-binding domain-containing protein [Gemmatimonadales bacterium]|nr:LysM peptidoglycan-binding domain-containing protein [Gemmatimonadales bacterium]